MRQVVDNREAETDSKDEFRRAGRVAGKIAGSNFEHQRFMLMARRAEGRTPGVTRTVRQVADNREAETDSKDEFRRAGRVAEGAPLLRVYTGNRIEGSNPSLSAIFLGMAQNRDMGHS